MGKRWDYDVPSVEVWAECLRVLKPGGHLLAFAGTRTQHRMACRIEDAGFEIRDMIAWVYGSGFPKSLDVSKAIDKAAGAEREVKKRHVQSATRPGEHAGASAHITMQNSWDITAPATPEAQQWAGWGTAFKPALEPITVARKPLTGTVAANVLEHGTGAINVDGCRVGTDGGTAKGNPPKDKSSGIYGHGINGACDILDIGKGRWPANLIHDGSDEVVGLFPQAKGQQGAVGPQYGAKVSVNAYGDYGPRDDFQPRGDTGSAARFFYCAKASKADRDEGCEGMDLQKAGVLNMRTDAHSERNGMDTAPRRNHHPTVKPTALMQYLCRLVTPPGGIVLDPFMGSGSTGKAAVLEGFRFIGIEREAEYVAIARARISSVETTEHQLTLSECGMT
jgi:hypothetical protein